MIRYEPKKKLKLNCLSILGHVVVNRCSGSCFPSSQECLPLEKANMTIRVMAVRSTFTSGGAWENVCAEIIVEKHIR